MNQSEYMDYMKTHPNWQPGWDAIKEQFQLIYGKDGLRFIGATEVAEGCEHLSGFGVAKSQKGYLHIVTCGLTNIDANVDAYGCARSGWGYEFTLKWPGDCVEACGDAFRLLDRLAAYMQVKKTWFSNKQAISLELLAFPQKTWPATFAGMLFVQDAELPEIDTVHGHVEFRQVVNITPGEMRRLKKFRSLSVQLIFNLSKQYPDLQMDLARKTNCLS